MMLKVSYIILALAVVVQASSYLGDKIRSKFTVGRSHQQEDNSAPSNPDEQLIFAFELVRHGARAPFDDRVIDDFTVGKSMLTPEGMRQRYLLGKYSKQRYTETYKLLSEEYVPSEIFVQSTNVNRTMQSGYSELMGLYPPGSAPTLSQAQVEIVSTGVSSPPFKVRDSDAINEGLGDFGLPNGFDQVDIAVFDNDDIHDDVSYDGCPFILDTEDARIDDPDVYADYMWMIDATRKPIGEMFNLTDEYIDSLNYHHYESLTDSAVAVDFEGYPMHETYFSDAEWETTHELQKIELTYRDSVDAGRLEASRFMRKPLDIMMRKIDNKLGGNRIASDIKYMIYSAHDDSIINMLNFLEADYFWIQYASTVPYELLYKASCLEDESVKGKEHCFGVKILSNGKPLDFDHCSGDLFTLHGCSFPEFLDLMADKWYSGPNADDLDQACFADPFNYLK